MSHWDWDGSPDDPGPVRRQAEEAPRPEVVRLMGALECGPEAAAEELRAQGVECVWEGERIVLLDALLLLERDAKGRWSGRSLADDDCDEVWTGAELEAALVWVVPYQEEVLP
jgi:hypothetical protein